jgi:cardiolipin synthase
MEPDARAYFPPLKMQGDKIVRVIGSSPDDRESLIYLALLSAISRAERSVDLTMAYFVPDRQLLDAVTGAARRGVAVRLITPGFSDSGLVLSAGRYYYATLLRAGVRIYERHDVMLHAKTAVIDGVWSTVGSANMDTRSFLHNDEVNAEVVGAEFGREMTAMFERDLATATPIDSESWESRPFSSRINEWFARLWQYWL